MDVLILRLDAPLMSFGAPMVDNLGAIEEFPGQSMLAGILANALGYDHRDYALTQVLQDRLIYAVRRDRKGTRLRDYQTVDLGQEHLDATGWTTRGQREDRGGGPASEGTHIRYRDFWADAVHTVAISFREDTRRPGISELESALRSPARPLFLGRKCCLPSIPLLFSRSSCSTLREAARSAPAAPPGRRDPGKAVPAWWPAEEGDGGVSATLLRVTDCRDWQNQIHVGERLVYHGLLPWEV